MLSARTNSTGSILLEVMLAVLILSFGLTFIVRGLLSSARAFGQDAVYFNSVFFMEQKLTELERMAFAGHGSKEAGFLAFSENDGLYRFEIDTAAARQERDSLKEVRLAVSWGLGAQRRKVSVHTYVFE